MHSCDAHQTCRHTRRRRVSRKLNVANPLLNVIATATSSGFPLRENDADFQDEPNYVKYFLK